jgi:probable F420-dependent oxidoreductase
VKFVTSLAFCEPRSYCALARAAEEAGFHAVAVSDHVVHPERIKAPYPYTPDGSPRWEPFTPWPDPWVAVGAMAAVTRRLRFVTSIFVLPMRNPFLVAKSVGTAAVLSDDRVALGVGAGWMEDEFELMEQPFAQRGARMDEMLEVMAKLWGGGMVEHHGRFYDFERLEMSPVPARPVPVYAGGLSAPALRRAATRCDGWVSDLHSTEELRGIVARLAEQRADSARAGQPFEVLAAVGDAFDVDGYRRVGEVGVTQLMTKPWVFYGGETDDVEAQCEGMRRFGDDVIAAFRDGA